MRLLPRDCSAQADGDGEYVVTYQVEGQQPTEVKLRRGDTVFVKRGSQDEAATACVVVNFEQPGKQHPGQFRYKVGGDGKPKELEPSKLLQNVIKPTLEARERSANQPGAGPSGSGVVASPARKKPKDDLVLKNQRRALRQGFCDYLNNLPSGQELEGSSWRNTKDPEVVVGGVLWQKLQVCVRKAAWANGWQAAKLVVQCSLSLG